jgi:N-acetylglutamate synthase-like GNAT family acetyltransferase
MYQTEDLAGFIAEQDGKPVGVLHYTIEGTSCEILSLISLYKGRGIGRGLLQTAIQAAHEKDMRRMWLITTNDNLDATRFYQRNGFRLCALYPGSVDQMRALKPEIPRIGSSGIPIRDEIELELRWERKESDNFQDFRG